MKSKLKKTMVVGIMNINDDCCKRDLRHLNISRT
jgi:hypothetical protein